MAMKPMLASEWDEKNQKFPLIASPKLDGIRCVVIEGHAISRSLKRLPNTYVQNAFGRDLLNGFDGELIVGSPTAKDVYRKTTSVVMSDEKLSAEPITYYVFDIWNYPNQPYTSRMQYVADRVNLLKKDLFPNVKVLPQVLIKTMEELKRYEQACLDEGYEGLILRDPTSHYKYGRSSTKEGIILKLKRFKDAEAVVAGFEEQLHNTNAAEINELGRTKRSSAKAGLVGKNTLGALVCVDCLTGVRFNIGTGMDDATRQEIWDNRKKYKDRIVKYKYFEIGVKDAPRHPVFLGFRSKKDM